MKFLPSADLEIYHSQQIPYVLFFFPGRKRQSADLQPEPLLRRGPGERDRGHHRPPGVRDGHGRRRERPDRVLHQPSAERPRQHVPHRPVLRHHLRQPTPRLRDEGAPRARHRREGPRAAAARDHRLRLDQGDGRQRQPADDQRDLPQRRRDAEDLGVRPAGGVRGADFGARSGFQDGVLEH